MSLAPPIPVHFGPNRRGLLEESQAGWCACCDILPIKSPRKSTGRGGKYTCGTYECLRAWGKACALDQQARKKAKAA